MIMITVKQYQEHESYNYSNSFHPYYGSENGPGFDSRWLPWAFFSLFLLAYNNVDGMKDLWC